jgi:hypothetical protein
LSGGFGHEVPAKTVTSLLTLPTVLGLGVILIVMFELKSFVEY